MKTPKDPFEDFNPILLSKKETLVLVCIILVIFGVAAYKLLWG